MNQKQNQLIKDIEKKCTTIMIGALVRFEETFGNLWEKEDERGDYYHDLWQKTRHEILNFGNHQTRLAVENMYKHFLNSNQNNKKYNYEIRFDHPKDKGDKE
jgi:hypothetical protein